MNYEVTVDATSADSAWAVAGDITIENNTPLSATVTGVSDSISGIGAVSVDCGVSFPTMLASGDTLTCTYSSALPNADTRTNTATVTTSGTVDGGTATASVDFASATVNKVDECIDVTDSLQGVLGTVCAGVDTLPKTFSYSRLVGGFSEADCGEHTLDKHRFVHHERQRGDRERQLADRHHGDLPRRGRLHADARLLEDALGTGPRAVRRHVERARAARREHDLLPEREDLLRGALDRPAGHAYYILAHAYIAAVLNTLNGASTTPAVDAALAWSATFFSTYTPSSNLSKTLRAQVIANAAILEAYNNGITGPGHCSE